MIRPRKRRIAVCPLCGYAIHQTPVSERFRCSNEQCDFDTADAGELSWFDFTEGDA